MGKSAAKGEQIFQQCSGCHSSKAGEKKVGPSLKGLFKKSKLLSGKPATEENICLVIKKGGDGMPSFAEVLSADEMVQLVAYLKRL
jgi:cytochrome c